MFYKVAIRCSWPLLLGCLGLLACSDSPTEPGDVNDTTPPATAIISDNIPLYRFNVINVYPHDAEAFTQGLVFESGTLYEGTGLRGHSSLRRVDLSTGRVEQRTSLAPDLFGEGIAIYRGSIVQLTWTARRGFVYDQESFALRREFQYSTEGWGITHDGTQLIMSDGTANLYFLNPETFERTGQVQVRDGSEPVIYLNELEFIQERVFANVWQSDRIAVIDPDDGRVTNWIDLNGLLPAEDRSAAVDVLNGIAFDEERSTLLVTGKRWPKLFEIGLVPAAE